MTERVRLAVLGVVAGLVVVGLFAVIRLAYPAVPGLGPSTPNPAGLSIPPGPPDTPNPALAPYVVAGHGRDGTEYSVTCTPKAEYDRGDENPDHDIDVPVTRDQFEALGFGTPCPTTDQKGHERRE